MAQRLRSDKVSDPCPMCRLARLGLVISMVVLGGVWLGGWLLG